MVCYSYKGGGIAVTTSVAKSEGLVSIEAEDGRIVEELRFSESERNYLMKTCWLAKKQAFIKEGLASYESGSLHLSFGDQGIRMAFEEGGETVWVSLNKAVNWLFLEMSIAQNPEPDTGPENECEEFEEEPLRMVAE